MLEKFEDEDEKIIAPWVLFDSMVKCKAGHTHKDSVAAFYLKGIEQSIKLSKQLQDGTYKPRKTREVKITHPKPRTAVSTAFRDRVYQRSLNDNAIYPQVSRSFIYDNMACQKGKGTDLARERFKEFLRRAYRLYGLDFYILQCDVKGYYDNMRHDVAKARFKRSVEPSAYKRAVDVLDIQYKGDVGYNPGSQMVQIAGIAVPDGLDHFVKEILQIELYERFMDDFALIHPKLGKLEYCQSEIQTYLGGIGMMLHPKKTKIIQPQDGIRFLGFVFRLTDTGKVIMTLDPENVKSERKKLFRVAALYHNGEITRRKADEMYTAWKAHASKGNSHRLIWRMDEYYRGHMNGGNYGIQAKKDSNLHQAPA